MTAGRSRPGSLLRRCLWSPWISQIPPTLASDGLATSCWVACERPAATGPTSTVAGGARPARRDLDHVVRTLRRQARRLDPDWRPDGPAADGIAHRYARGHSVIDVLAPEGLGARADLTTTPPRRPGVAGATALEQRPGAAAERRGNRGARPRCLARPRPAGLEGGEADATHPAPRGASARRARLRSRCRTSGVPRCGPRGIRPRRLGVSPPPGGPVAAWRHHNVHL